jgi:hypothetical protein
MACVAATLAMVVGAPILGRGLEAVPGVRYQPRVNDVVIQPVFVLTGAALAWLRPRNPLGWLLMAMGTTNIGNVFLGTYGVRAHVVRPALPGGDIALAMASWLWFPLVFFLPAADSRRPPSPTPPVRPPARSRVHPARGPRQKSRGAARVTGSPQPKFGSTAF